MARIARLLHPCSARALLGILALGALLAACGRADGEQARLCRLALPALQRQGESVELRAVRAVQDGRGVRIDYVAATAAGERARTATCAFAGAGFDGAKRDLVGVTTEDGPLSDAAMVFLRRFWLATPEAALADPGLPAGRLPVLPRALAVGAQHVVAALPSIGVLALLAGALALVHGLVGRPFLAFGEFAALGGAGALLGAVVAGGYGPLAGGAAALAAALGVAGFYGAVAGRALLTPLLGRPGWHLVVASLGLGLALQEWLRLAQGPGQRWLPPVTGAPVALARAAVAPGEAAFLVTAQPLALGLGALCLGAVLALLLALKRSRFGREWRAVADDPAAAALLGVSRRAVAARTMALAGALAGLGGFVVAVGYGAIGHAGGAALGLKALIGAVAGGVGSVPGAVLGGALVGVVDALWPALMTNEGRDAALLALLVAFLVLRPEGLLGRPGEGSPRGRDEAS